MYHNFLLHKNHPQQEQLEKVIELILGFVNADSIYLSSHLEDKLNEGIITVIIPEDSPHDWDDLSNYCWKIFESYPEFSFRIFDLSWFEDELKNGNPFFVMHCSSKELLYSTGNSGTPFAIDKLKTKKFLREAKYRYEIKNRTSFAFGLNVRHYKNGRDYNQAAYTLHQTIKFLYVSASWFLSGEWIVTQDLAAQQKHLGKFSKSLGNVFDLNNPLEFELLQKLNSSCYSVQNNEQLPEITLEMIEAIETKENSMELEIKRLFDECLSRCKYQFSTERTPLIEIDQNNPLKMIFKTITDSIETIGIYCFGQHTISKSLNSSIFDIDQEDFESKHFYLLVIVKKYNENFTADIANVIKTRTNGKFAVTVLLQSKKSLFHKSTDQKYFYSQIIKKGELIYQNSTDLPYSFFDEIPNRNISSVKRYIEQRNDTKSIFTQAESLDGGSATKVHIYMIHIIVEQTCLSLIRLFLGFTPNHFSLSYLFDLCEYFTPLTAEIFPRQTFKDKALLKLLSSNMCDLRHGAIDKVEKYDYDTLVNRYEEFVQRADELIALELERLEKVNENLTLNN